MFTARYIGREHDKNCGKLGANYRPKSSYSWALYRAWWWLSVTTGHKVDLNTDTSQIFYMMNKHVIHTAKYVVQAPHIKYRKYKVYQITKSINKIQLIKDTII